MNLFSLLMFVLIQGPTDASADSGALRAGAEDDVSNAEVLPLNELRQRIAGGEYLPLPRSLLEEVLESANAQNRTNPASAQPRIRAAEYSAVLNGTRLESGMLQYDIYSEAEQPRSGPLLIGPTSLQNLTISDGQGMIPLGADSLRRLFVLRPDPPEQLTGTWTCDGLVAGDVVTFRLELPAATTSRMMLTTAAGIEVTGTGSLVLPSESEGDTRRWMIYPGDASRLTFSCRARQSLKAQDPLPLVSFNASHLAGGDVLSSRWTLGLPADFSSRALLTARVSSRVRIADVVLDDKRPVEWQVMTENGQQILRMTLPEASGSATLTISSASDFSQSETWELPMLSIAQWQSIDGQLRGPVLMPIGQISVRLPPSIELDEWVLLGIQERDVVTGPDQSREFRLTQFLPEASAVARTSVSVPQLTDSVVTVVEPAGRAATVRCFVNVACEESAVVELQWPVTAGWHVISARYAADARALFFESIPNDPMTGTTALKLHLPETLEPGSSRTFEFQLQQSDAADPRALSLPLAASAQMTRIDSVVMFPPAFSLSSDLQHRWSSGRRSLTNEEVRQKMPWFPETGFSAGGQSWDVIDATLFSQIAATETETPDPGVVRLEYSIRFDQGQIAETSRIVLPPGVASGDSISLLLPAGFEPRWFLDGEPVAARRVDTASEHQAWTEWSIAVSGRRAGLPAILRSEIAHASGSEFVAAIPRPQSGVEMQGTLQLVSSEEGLLTVGGLEPEIESSVTNATPIEHSTRWKLPNKAEAIRVRVENNPRIEGGQTIDIHMLHLIGEHAAGLEQEVLTVATVSRSAGQRSLPLSLPQGIRPLVLVNLQRVQLLDTPTGLEIPLPPSSGDCQVLLTWKEPAKRPEDVTGKRHLPRLFLRDRSVPQCTHHVLVSPVLELRGISTTYAASEPMDVIRMLDRLLNRSGSGTNAPSAMLTASMPAEVRMFMTRWQLAAAQGWQHRTMIDTAASETSISVEITQTRRRLAISAGAFMVLFASCVGLRQSVHQYRLTVAVVTVGLLGMSYPVESVVVESMLLGGFWGLTAGLLLVILFRCHWPILIGRKKMIRSIGSIVLLIPGASRCSAWQQPSADVLIPERPVPGSDIVYVRRSLLDQWQRIQSMERQFVPQAVVTSLRTRIVAESAESVELVLHLGVATVSGEEESSLRIPLRGSRLVECLVDGRRVLPEPAENDAILVPVPASVIVKSVPLGAAALDVDDGDLPTSSLFSAANEPGTTFVDAGPHAAFTVHSVECRLRPVTARQSSGVQFQLPGLPCPSATIEVIAPAGMFASARAQTSAGVVQWNPADGDAPMNGLALSDGGDVRLFLAGASTEAPEPAAVEMLAVSEVISGQQLLNCVCRISKWNLLTPELRYRIPSGYELLSVSTLTASSVESPSDLLWSKKDQAATILLPRTAGNEFVLSLRLRSQTPARVEEQPLPIVELQDFFSDCVPSPRVLLAVRANPVFSVLPLEGGQIATAAFADVQSVWGPWIRRSDSLFRVPSAIPACIVRLTPRTSVNEVRVGQEVRLQNALMDWACRIDIETSVLPVFRHRLTINSDVEISDVQVSAGEANRLASWHRRGDQLLIQLKEGTTGLHVISIQGRRILRPDDPLLTLQSPRLQNSQILESSLTLTDLSGLGLVFAKLGGAVPDQPIKPEGMLVAGSSVRLQIVDDADPVVLQRVRPVEPTGAIAVIRSTDQATFVMHVSQWSGSLGPLHLRFADDTEFVQEPIVLAAGLQHPLIREADEFVADQDAVRSLFEQSEFTVVWAMSIDESQKRQQSAVFAWPSVSDSIAWSECLLIPLDVVPGSAEDGAGNETLPAWLTDAAARVGAIDLSSLKAKAIEQSLEATLQESQLTIPVRHALEQFSDESSRELFAVSDTIVWSNPNQSAVGETVFLLFAARTPARCSLRIPAGTVVTELDSDQPTRWKDSSRAYVVVELSQPVTIVKTRWLSERASGSMLKTQLSLLPPFAADCKSRRIATVTSSEQQLPRFTGGEELIPAGEMSSLLTNDINTGLNHARPVGVNADLATEPLPSVRNLTSMVTESRRRFLENFFSIAPQAVVTASCRPGNSSEVLVSIDRSLQVSTIVSLSAGFFLLIFAAFSRGIAVRLSRLDADLLARSGGVSRAENTAAEKSSSDEYSLASDLVNADGADEDRHQDRSGSEDLPVNKPGTTSMPATTVRTPSSVSGGSLPK